MTKKKFKLLKDNCLYDLSVYPPKIYDIANIVSLEDLGLSASSSDEEILAAGQREGRVVWTSDAGYGFSLKNIQKPDFNRTGVIISKEEYNENDQFKSLYNLWQVIDFKDLYQKRTTINLEYALIQGAGAYKRKIKF